MNNKKILHQVLKVCKTVCKTKVLKLPLFSLIFPPNKLLSSFQKSLIHWFFSKGFYRRHPVYSLTNLANFLCQLTSLATLALIPPPSTIFNKFCNITKVRPINVQLTLTLTWQFGAILENYNFLFVDTIYSEDDKKYFWESIYKGKKPSTNGD